MEQDIQSDHSSPSFIIRATNVPFEFFENRDGAKKYFRRFGKVKLVMFKPKTRSVLVEYGNEDSMLNALELAGEYKGNIFHIARDPGFSSKKKDEDPDWLDDPEVRAELEAMGGFGVSRSYNLRGEAMNVDSIEPPFVKSTNRKWQQLSSNPPKPQQKKKVDPKQMEEKELLQIIKQKAQSIEDKFRILDARDKLIRLTLKKKIETNSSPTVGTCPDMCPEKERLMREIQHQVALYEQNEDKTMSSRLAIKQYSRSSADQEAPLSQELRPVAVLQMTMGYLLHRIIDLCNTTDVNIGEWYHFLWDRTRGIRKDITQQELCSQGSVTLVEQCARFHIVCSARLVAEDPSIFDHRINTENLTKCLQTLKYMYHDLQLKDETCPNEPEFRAYIILLNLNDGNFMWEVQQFKPEIQRSTEVQFALSVHSSLDKGNYVKFFKLVNSTTYLNACILVRYFVQVRTSALKILLKSYSPRTSQASLNVHYLTNILAFENNDATIEFIESHGLYTNNDKSRVVLNRGMFTLPEYPFVLDRAINLVESKRNLSLGEVICGTKLPPKVFDNHIPQDSFDVDGYLKFNFDEPDVESISRKETTKVEHIKKTSFPLSVISNKSEPILDILKPISSDSFSSFATKESSSAFVESIPKTKSIWPTVTSASGNIFESISKRENIFGKIESQEDNKYIPQSLPSPKHEEIFLNEELVKEEELNRLQELEERKEKELLRIQAEEKRKIEEEKIRLLLKHQKLEEEQRARRVAAITKQKIEEKRKKEKIERLKNKEIVTTVEEVINEIVNIVTENIKEEKLINISKNIMDRKLKKVLGKWMENTRKKRKRKAFDLDPVWGINELENQISTLGNFKTTLYNIKRYKRSHSLAIFDENCDILKLDISKLIYNLLTKKHMEVEKKMSIELFWKVIVSIPNEIEFNHGLHHLEEIIRNCINWKVKGHLTVAIEQINLNPTVTYYIERQKGLIINNHNDANGFIFIGNEFNDAFSERISANLENCSKFARIPIVFLVQKSNKNGSKQNNIIYNEKISDSLTITNEFNAKNLMRGLKEAFEFLASRIEKSPPLLMDTLKSFLIKYLCNDLWKRAKSFSKWNSNYKTCLKDPNTVIYLHNEALGRLKQILFEKSYPDYYQFPEVFKELLRSEIPEALPCDYKYFPSFWHSPSYIRHVEGVINSLYFPNFFGKWPPSDEIEFEECFLEYFPVVFKEPEKSYFKILELYVRKSGFGENWENVLWIDLMEVMVLEKLDQTDFSLYGTGFVNKSIFNQLIIVYNNELLTEYCKSDWFYINNPIIKPKIFHMLVEEKNEARPIICEKINDNYVDIDKIWNNLNNYYSPKDIATYKSNITDFKNVLNDLEESITIHRKILEKSGNFLKHIVEN